MYDSLSSQVKPKSTLKNLIFFKNHIKDEFVQPALLFTWGQKWRKRHKHIRACKRKIEFCIILRAILFLYFLPKISFAFLSMLIIFIANNNYNHHNDKSLRQQMKDKINYWIPGKGMGCF